MATNVIYLSKAPSETLQDSLDMTLELQLDEAIASVATGLITPSGVTFDYPNFTTNQIFYQVSGGSENVTYGIRIDITTSYGRVIPVTLAVLVSSQVGYEYQISNQEGIQTLIDQIIAGESAVGNALFNLPIGTETAGGYINWELLDSDGITFSSGNAFELIATNTSNSLRIEGRGIITVPSDVPVNNLNLRYQIRWTLNLPDGTTLTTNENIKVLGRTSIPHGVEDSVEMQGDVATLNIVVPQFFDHVGVEVYKQSHSEKMVSYQEATDRHKVPDGYQCSVRLDTSNIPVALESYVVIWKYWNHNNPNLVFRESGRMFVLNASILSATDDLRAIINRSRATIAHKQDILFTVPTLLVFLRQGRDSFNGAYGVLTNFDMSDATSSIRQYWLYFAGIDALRSQYLAEGEKAFNYSGQSINLDVDRTAYYESLASTIQSRMDNECKPFKQNLIKKGIIQGTGNLDSIGLRHGAIGSIGIGVSAASGFGRYIGKLGTTVR